MDIMWLTYLHYFWYGLTISSDYILSQFKFCLFPKSLAGAHHFYLGRNGWGILYLFTVGLLGIGWLLDALYLPSLVKKINKKREAQTMIEPEGKSLFITYLLAIFPISGFLGGHHYYLGNYIFGFFYTLSLGNMGIGYIVDLFRTPLLFRRAKTYNSMIGFER